MRCLSQMRRLRLVTATTRSLLWPDHCVAIKCSGRGRWRAQTLQLSRPACQRRAHTPFLRHWPSGFRAEGGCLVLEIEKHILHPSPVHEALMRLLVCEAKLWPERALQPRRSSRDARWWTHAARRGRRLMPGARHAAGGEGATLPLPSLCANCGRVSALELTCASVRSARTMRMMQNDVGIWGPRRAAAEERPWTLPKRRRGGRCSRSMRCNAGLLRARAADR